MSKPHLVSWEIVSHPKVKRALGIGGIVQKKQALLGKWLWRFLGEQTFLWASIIRSNFGHGLDGLELKANSTLYPLESSKRCLSNLPSFSSSYQSLLGNGCKIRFWIDKWAANQPLSVLFSGFLTSPLKNRCNYSFLSILKLACPSPMKPKRLRN